MNRLEITLSSGKKAILILPVELIDKDLKIIKSYLNALVKSVK